MTVHLFGATSSPSCAGFALRKTAEDHKNAFDNDTSTAVLENFYVDDCLKSVPDAKQGRRLIPQLRDMLMRSGFRLVKWASNDRTVLDVVPPDERARSVVDCDQDHLPTERTLGVLWDMERDKFMFKVSPKEVQPTRRGILSATSSLYDPLGFVAPFILTAKFLIQDLCSKGLRWDEIVGPEEQRQWNE